MLRESVLLVRGLIKAKTYGHQRKYYNVLEDLISNSVDIYLPAYFLL